MKITAAWLAALALLAVSASAAAETDPVPGPSAEAPDEASTRPTLNVRAAPVFGSDAATGDGWSEVVVGLDNVGGSAKKGTVELTSSVPWGRDQRFVTRAPFNVTPGRTAIVRLPTHGFTYQTPTLTLLVKGDDGTTFADINVAMSGSNGPLLVDVSQPSRLAVVMRNWPLSIAYNPTTSGAYGSSSYGSLARATLTVGAPTYDRTSGDPVLPEHAASYAPVTVVLIRSDALARLEATSLTALVDWVIAGGTLAVVPTRPEDLRGPPLASILGGPATTAPPPPVLMTLPARSPTTPPSGLPGDPLTAPQIEPDGPFDLLDPPAPDVEPIGFVLPARTVTRPAWPRLGPSPEVREKLVGYLGGNLVPSVYGSSAPYGAGEVHLLAFDPTISPALEDPWIQSRVADLVAHAWDHRASIAAPIGGGSRYLAQLDGVRRALDPNENFRPALGISAILLVIYSILAGPVTFLRAAKRGKPLAPLKWAPLWAAGAFGTIVLVGLAGKGWRGRGRHISLLEAGAGMGRGTVRRYRGFFASETRALTIPATDTSGVLSLVTTDSAGEGQSSLKLDRDGASLENITSLPWQTIVVREDAMVDLHGGVSILPTSDGSVDVINHTGRVLERIIVSVPRDGLRYFDRLADGEHLHAADGRALSHLLGRATLSAGTLSVHQLEAGTLGGDLGGKEGAAFAEAWRPLDSALGNSVDWWPDGVPVVLAEIEGGERTKRDAGLSVESDRALLRIVGQGGAR